jgi:DNA-binding PadR family transcriptional regulator
MNAPVKLFILGVLLEGERHGYDVAARAKSLGVGEWPGFGAGSLYHALAALERAGDIARLRTEQRGKYPARSVYKITPKGKDSVGRFLVQASQEVLVDDSIDLVLSFVPAVPAADRRQLLELRLGLLVNTRDELKRERTREQGLHAAPWRLASIDRRIAVLSAQIEWLLRVVDDVGKWKTHKAGDTPPQHTKRPARRRAASPPTDETSEPA